MSPDDKSIHGRLSRQEYGGDKLSKKRDRGHFSLLLSISGAGLILVGLIPVISCDRQQPGIAKAEPNPVWLQVETLKKEQRDVAGQILSRDLKPLDEAIADPLPVSTAETVSVEPGSSVALIHRASGGWSRAFDVRLGVLQASSLDKVRALIGIKETEISLGPARRPTESPRTSGRDG